MKSNRHVLIVIIILLAIFLSLSIIGLYNRKIKLINESNPNHDTFYKGNMYFYSKANELLNKYECQTESCNYASSIIDDKEYNINYYQDGKINKTSLINYKYAFIQDGSKINLYTITGKVLKSYSALKTYNTKLENNDYILKNENNLWGVVSINDNLRKVLPFEYKGIYLKNNLNNELLNTSKYIVNKDNKWFIVDRNNNTLSNYFDNPIIDYNDKYIINNINNQIKVFDYQKKEYLSNYNIKKYVIEDKYIGIITNEYFALYEDLNNFSLKRIEINSSMNDFDLKKEGNKLNIIINKQLKDYIEIR